MSRTRPRARHVANRGRGGPAVAATPPLRLAAALALAGLASFPGVGCQTTSRRAPADTPPPSALTALSPPTTNASAPNPTSANPTKPVDDTRFKANIGPEKEFQAHLDFARLFERDGKNEAAVAEYQKALDVAEVKGSRFSVAKLGPPEQALAHRRMGEAFDRMGRCAQADMHYSKALKLAPNDAKVWNSVGYSYFLQERYADSEAAYKTAARLDPADPKIQNNLGEMLAAAGKTDEALVAFTKAGGPAVGRANLGFILAAMGQRDEAKRQYEAALKIQPALTIAGEALAQLKTPASDPSVAVASAAMPTPDPAPVKPTAPRDAAPTPPPAAVVPEPPMAKVGAIPIPMPVIVGRPVPPSADRPTAPPVASLTPAPGKPTATQAVPPPKVKTRVTAARPKPAQFGAVTIPKPQPPAPRVPRDAQVRNASAATSSPMPVAPSRSTSNTMPPTPW